MIGRVSAPNVLLVVLDAARRDALEPYGADPGSTPAIAQLARRGSAVPRAYATASWTLPSHASMFTGKLSRGLGLGQAPGGSPTGARQVLEAQAGGLLSSALRDAGYETQGFSANLWASGAAGFDLGFDNFTYVSGGRSERLDKLTAGLFGGRPAWALEGLRARGDDGATELGTALRAAIERAGSKPSFWFVNLTECHSPYLPPRPWNDLGAVDRMRAALDAQTHQNFQAICLYAAGRHSIPIAAMERMRHLYGRAIAYMDAWLADVLEALDRRGILDETLVIVTADHGESFGEAGVIAHGFALSEPLIHVPLLIAGPGAETPADLFSLAELPALILSAAGVVEHPIFERALPHGVAIAQYDALAPPDDPRMREFTDRFELDQAAIARLTTSFTCATDGRWKLLLGGDGERRYDLDADPDEQVQVQGDPDGVFARLRAELERAGALDEAVAGSATAADEPSDEERAALERQLKLLGYL
jgi:arylsulfatase A-like enzyme